MKSVDEEYKNAALANEVKRLEMALIEVGRFIKWSYGMSESVADLVDELAKRQDLVRLLHPELFKKDG